MRSLNSRIRSYYFQIANRRSRQEKRRVQLGCAADPDIVSGARETVIKRYARIFGPTNAGKWGALLDGTSADENDYVWTDLDTSANFITTNNLVGYFHTLLWSKDTFFAEAVGKGLDLTNEASRQPSFYAHIDAILGRYQGVFKYVDVWNEIIDGTGSMEANPFGTDITVAEMATHFNRAHAADPQAILLYNDFGCETPGNRQDGVFTLCSDLIDAGAEIHGVGFQFHIDLDGTEPTFEEMDALFKRFRALRNGNFRVIVSELDLSVASIALEADKLDAQAAFAKDLARAASINGVDLIRTWGTLDDDSWRYDKDGTTYPTEQPLAFDPSGNPKSFAINLFKYTR